jgi:hypothetical protein
MRRCNVWEPYSEGVLSGIRSIHGFTKVHLRSRSRDRNPLGGILVDAQPVKSRAGSVLNFFSTTVLSSCYAAVDAK